MKGGNTNENKKNIVCLAGAGVVAPIDAWGVVGGGIQFELAQYIAESCYGNGIPLS